jgi:hypothetical protein
MSVKNMLAPDLAPSRMLEDRKIAAAEAQGNGFA